MIDKISDTINTIREQKPLVLCLTNSVTQDIVANTLLALGAAPIISACVDELEELSQIASSLYINIGTLDESFLISAPKAIELSKSYKKPIVLDPVGSGASAIRTNTSRNMMVDSQIIRGNASEIISLAQNTESSKGVESSHTSADAKEIAKLVASKTNATVVVSGAVDFITNGVESHDNAFGSPTMQLITGMGCALTGVCAAFHSVVSDSFDASVLATTYFGLCGEIVSKSCTSPGSFRAAFLDQIYNPDFKNMRQIYAV